MSKPIAPVSSKTPPPARTLNPRIAVISMSNRDVDFMIFLRASENRNFVRLFTKTGK